MLTFYTVLYRCTGWADTNEVETVVPSDLRGRPDLEIFYKTHYEQDGNVKSYIYLFFFFFVTSSILM